LTPCKIEKSEDEKNAAGMHRKLVTDLAGRKSLEKKPGKAWTPIIQYFFQSMSEPMWRMERLGKTGERLDTHHSSSSPIHV
jgi:hypothetical protein